MRNAMPSVVLVLVLLAALYVLTAGRDGGGAACGATLPSLEAGPARAAPDGSFRLHGEGFYGDFICDDTGPAFLSRPAGGRPTGGIRVEFVQGTKTWTLATVTSDEDLAFDAERLTVPADASPGKAVVRATSPAVERAGIPPQGETPFLVLDRLLKREARR